MTTPAPKLSPPHGVCVLASLLGLFLWAILSSVSAARPLRYTLPTFMDTPVNVTAYRGTDVELPCSVHNLGPKVVVWKKFSQVNPLTIGEFIYDPDSRYSVVRSAPHDSGEWNLRISDVQMADAGVYECQISTKEDFTRNISLFVLDAEPHIRRKNTGKIRRPDKTGIKLEGNQFVEKGMPILLNCTATAIDYLPKGVDWFKDGSKVKSDAHVLIREKSDDHALHSTLEILRSNMTDAGTYVCRSSKLNVDSQKVIVLNTGSSNIRRESERVDVTSGQPNRDRQPSRAKACAPSSSSSSSVLLLLLALILSCSLLRPVT